jgi:hypothetical protein
MRDENTDTYSAYIAMNFRSISYFPCAISVFYVRVLDHKNLINVTSLCENPAAK